MDNEITIEPFDKVVINSDTKTGEIILSNNGVEKKAFKIKTTKPNEYTVRPSMGVLPPLQKTIIEITAQECVEATNDHKFMIEVFNYDSRKITDVKEFFSDLTVRPIFKKVLVTVINFVIPKTEVGLLPKNKGEFVDMICITFLAIPLTMLIFKMLFNCL